MYVNSRGTNEIEVIDRDARRIVATWPITLGKGNVPMALDEVNHRLFVGCRDGKMVVLDTTNGKELQALPITKGTDDMVFDPVKKRIYAANDGAVDVYEQTDADHYKLLANSADRASGENCSSGSGVESVLRGGSEARRQESGDPGIRSGVITRQATLPGLAVSPL